MLQTPEKGISCHTVKCYNFDNSLSQFFAIVKEKIGKGGMAV